MWERKELNLEFKTWPPSRIKFLLGSVALYKKFCKGSFTDRELDELFSGLNKQNFTFYSMGKNTAFFYYSRGVIERNPERIKRGKHIIREYRVLEDRMKKIEKELLDTGYKPHLDRLDELIPSLYEK